MRFALRALNGLVMTALSLGLVAYGLWHFLAAEPAARRAGEGATERVFKVKAKVLRAQTVIPEIATYGRVKSWRRAPIAAAVRGDVTWISENLRDGAEVTAGERLLEIDPLTAELALAEAETDLREAVARGAEATESVTLARAELDAAQDMLALRGRQLGRQQELQRSGSTSKAAMDNAEMERIAAAQALAAKRLALVRATNEIELAALAEERARLARDRAGRELADTTVQAPFAGVLASVDVAFGREVTAGEVLAELVDLDALEVEIDLTPAELARLLDGDGRLLSRPVTVSQTSGGLELVAPGRLLRAGAEVGAAGSGRTVYAGLPHGRAAAFRPGDFVTVRIEEPARQDVALVSSSALDDRDRLMRIDADNRLEALPVTRVGRLGDEIVLADVPFGALYVERLLPQLGVGVKVEPVGAPESSDLISQGEPSAPAGDS